MTRPDRWRPYWEEPGYNSHLNPRLRRPGGEWRLIQPIVVAEPLPDFRPVVEAMLADAMRPSGQMVARPGMDLTYASFFRPRTNPTPKE